MPSRNGAKTLIQSRSSTRNPTTAGSTLKPHDLIASARILIAGEEPSEASLCRAVSTAYYALFHLVAGEIANSVVPDPQRGLSEVGWHLAYRGLDHSALRNACRNSELLRVASPALTRIAKVVPEMQAKRHLADYGPHTAFTQSEVSSDLDDCEAAIHAFTSAPESERRAFVAFVLFKTR